MSQILLVEDKQSLRTMLQRTLEDAGYVVDPARDGTEAQKKLQAGRYLLMLTDLRLPGVDGMGLLKEALTQDPDLPVIVMTAYGTIDTAVQAMKMGAYDFIEKPVDNEHLLILVRRARERRELLFENLVLREEFKDKLGFPQIIGEHGALKEVSEAVQRAGPTDVTVLLTGESGTGKELFARAVHALSPRAHQRFVAINCAAIPDTLLENELFGHEKGAYTGAGERKIGKFEMAHRGTILLDEIGDLSLSVQAKILRVLQEKSFERVGGTSTIEADVRVIAATNRDLEEAVREKQFRQDLFFRLSVFPIEVPPLRARKEDIPLLAGHFVETFCRDMNKRLMTLHEQAMIMLSEYGWPGNVRELQNCIERAVILCDGGEILPHHLNLQGDPRVRMERELRNVFSLEGTLAEVSDRAVEVILKVKVEAALRESRGDRRRAAEILGISSRSLTQRIKELGISDAP